MLYKYCCNMCVFIYIYIYDFCYVSVCNCMLFCYHTTTKLTRETAFNSIFHQYMRPPIFTIIIHTVNATIIAENNDNPVKIRVTKKITQRDKPNENNVSVQIVRYCS